DPLRLFQPKLALAEVAKDEHAGERVLEPAAALLEEPLLGWRPSARRGALVETQHVRAVALRMDGHRDHRPDAELARRVRRQGVVRTRSEWYRGRRRPHESEDPGGRRIDGQFAAEREDAGE